MKIVPITLKEANEFVASYHRHHRPTVSCKFAIGLQNNGDLVGVAICGRPVSRYLDVGNRCRDNGVPREKKKRWIYEVRKC